MAPGVCSTGRTWWAAMPRTAHAIRAPNRLSWREEIPHPPRDFLSPPPHRRKKVQILGPDTSCANRTGHLDVLTILMWRQKSIWGKRTATNFLLAGSMERTPRSKIKADCTNEQAKAGRSVCVSYAHR